MATGPDTQERADADESERPVEDYPRAPGPDGLPFLGNTHQLVRGPFAFFDALAEHGDVVRYSAMGREFTALLHPDHIERVLVEEPDRFQRFLFSDSGFDFAPSGILFNDNDRGDRQRAIMRPAFTMDRIRTYGDVMAAGAVETAEQWDDGDEVVLNRTFSDLTLRILAEALFDVSVDPGGEDAVIPRAARVINDLGDTQGASVILPDWIPTPTRRRYRRTMDEFRERMSELIEDRRVGADSDDAGDADLAGDDLLSILLTVEGPDGETLSEEEVRDNLLTFMFAGHETTSLALTYTFLLLSQHDEAAETLRQEVDEVLDDDRARFEDVPRLEYTEQVVREALRLYPPAFAMWREAQEDAVFDGYRVPEGTYVTLPQFHVHTDERFWDAPDEFRPERWADDRQADRPEYAYFPFGGGPRHCIGMRFAMLELQLVVATIASRFEMTLLSDPDPALSPGATLHTEEDVRVRVHRR